MEHVSFGPYDERHGRVAHWRVAQVEPFRVPAHHFVLPRKPIHAGAEVPRISELPVYPRGANVELQSLRNHHCGTLQLKTMVEKLWQTLGAGSLEVVEPAPVILPLE